MATILAHRSTPSPRYTPHPQDVELSRLDSVSPSILSEPPPYDEATGAPSFHPTVHLQIETTGKPWLSLPLPLRPDPIPIFTLQPEESSSSAASHTPKFLSLRPERCSGSCYLVSSSDSVPLSTTTYRFGPNRPPQIRLFHPANPPLSPSAVQTLLFPPKGNKETPQSADPAAPEPWDEFTVCSLGLLTRAVTFRTRLGTFQWRYASRKERHARARSPVSPASDKPGSSGSSSSEVSSLLVLERVVRIATARNQPRPGSSSSRHAGGGGGGGGGGSHDEQVRTVVAEFIRGPEYRTAGSSGSSAGNGGRLVVDLGLFGDREGGGDGGEGKGDREMALVMVVTTCLLMLKREVDRRRAQQIAIMAGAASGGS
ncbi:hypothetical protein MFIFM68171_03195 [Madurella fahalii]|uniref:Uncharacterized protein n=1 Tax=Madurella fahalii TaxID=1157608 RepID=A0ABQ0G5H5_9PEZI